MAGQHKYTTGYGTSYEEEGLLSDEEPTEVEDRQSFPFLRVVLLSVVGALVMGLGVVGTSMYQKPSLAVRSTDSPVQAKAAALSVKLDSMDDTMTEQCVQSTVLSDFGDYLQILGGNKILGYPMGGALLSDRGQYSVLKNTTDYDYRESYNIIIDNYDTLLDACNTVDEGGSNAMCEQNTTAMEVIDVKDEDLLFNMTGQIPCMESCVQDRIILYASVAGTAPDYQNCTDPVTAAMVLAPPFSKSCFSPSWDCTEGGIHDCPTVNDLGCFDCITSECLGLDMSDYQF